MPFARYSEFVHESSQPAICRSAIGYVYSNSSGRMLLVQHESDINQAFDQTLKSGKLQRLTFESGDFYCIPLLNESSTVEAVLGTTTDISDLPALLHRLHKPTRHFSEIVHNLPQIIMTARPSGIIDYVSRQWKNLLDHLGPSSPHASFFAAVVEEQKNAVVRLWEKGTASQVSFEFSVCLNTTRGNRWYLLSASPVFSHGKVLKWAISLADITADYYTRAALDLSRLRLVLLSEVGRIVGKEASFQQLAQQLAEALGTWSGSLAIVDFCYKTEKLGSACYGFSKAENINEITNALSNKSSADFLEKYPDLIVAPIRGTEFPLGHIAVQSSKKNEPEFFSDYEENNMLISEISSRIAAALENLLHRRHERHIANVLQQNMLPIALPQIPGMHFDLLYEPAESDLLVGGDWYDVFTLPSGRIVLSIGDVMGHGLNAAVIMGKLRQSIRSASYELNEPHTVLARANLTACAEIESIATTFVAFIDPFTLQIQYANAGHCPPVIVGANGKIERLQTDGPPLGVTLNAALQTYRSRLNMHEALVLYTDGLTESGSHFSDDSVLDAQLIEWAQLGFLENAKSLQRRIMGSKTRKDDAAMLILRVLTSESLQMTFEATSLDSTRARYAVERYLFTNKLSKDRVFEFTLAVAEAMNNASEHAYHSRGYVNVHLYRERNSIIAVVRDNGVWRKSVPSDRGRGILIMKQYSDEVHFSRTKKGTAVRLKIMLDQEDESNLAQDIPEAALSGGNF